MSLLKKVLIVFLVLVVLLQIPGIYSRFLISSLDGQINQTRLDNTPPPGFDVYVGVSHVHSSLGGHSTGSFDELIYGAAKNELDFVIMNEHVSHQYDTSMKTLREKHGKTLFLGGHELSSKDGDRFLVTEGDESLGNLDPPTNKELVGLSKDTSRLLLQAYLSKSPDKTIKGDGVEFFSLHTNAKRMNPVHFLSDAFWSFRAYPELTLARHFQRPDEILTIYDSAIKERRLILFAGVDAHSNIGLRLADDANNSWLRIKFDEYESIFKLVRNHVLLSKGQELTKENLLTAIKQGNTYTSFDVLGSGVGFDFYTQIEDERNIMGSETYFRSGTQLRARVPAKSRVVLFRDGKQVFQRTVEKEFKYKPESAGAYRVEVYRDELGSPFDKMPWILSNPIYLR